MDNVRILFVLSNKCSHQSEASETMIQAFEECKQNTNNVTWINCSEIDSVELNKTDFLVFDEFEGDTFKIAKETKSAILGPWAIRVCLMESKPIPNYPWPIYNVAMYNIVITCSALSKTEKSEIKRKVELMGGCYEDNLVASTTHLVTLKAKSEKYFTATESGLKIMRPSWIDDVWQISQSVNVDANSESFNKHKCLTFEGLTICTTGLSITDRKNAEKVIRENGGTFTGNLVIDSTDVLCCGPESTSSNKYIAARQVQRIKCVNLSWITDCVHKGYSLRPNNYQMQKFTSTPTKSDAPVNPNYSVLSAIGRPDFSLRANVEDTIAPPLTPTKLGTNKRKAKMIVDYKELIDNLDIKRAKKAGQYLDGLSVYLTGFSPEHTEKLNKILNFSGATRNDKFSDRITHVVVGDSTFHEVNIIKSKGYSCMLVSVQWLLESINKGSPVNEEEYLLSMSDVDRSGLGSPLSKKGLSLLRSNRTVTQKEIDVDNVTSNNHENMEPDIVQQYLKSNNGTEEDTLAKLLEGMEDTNFSKQGPSEHPPIQQCQPTETSTQQSSMTVTQDKSTEISMIFENLKFLVLGFDVDEYNELKEKIEEFGGQLVPKNYKGVPDFAVLPIFNKLKFHHTASEVVNNLFIYECETAKALVSEILYYHRPFDIFNTRTLENCVITISSYGGYERVFLNTLIEVLGGVAQEQFARVTSETKGVVASTHLVSPIPSGKKYEAALKWKLPVVTNQWLLECSKTGKRVPEGEYLLRDSKVPGKMEESTHNITQSREVSADRLKTMCATPTTSTVLTTSTKVLTPANHATPLIKRFRNSSEKPFSPLTPVNKIMRNFNENIQNTPIMKETSDYSLPQPWMNIKTPKTPLGACLTPNPSPGLRKQFAHWLQQFPDKSVSESNTSTPVSEIKRKLWDKILHTDKLDQPDFNESQGTHADSIDVQKSDSPRTPENQHLANKLQQLEDMLCASGGGKRHSRNFQATIPVPTGNREYQDSQPYTVGWDFLQEEPRQQPRIFTLSGIADDEIRAKLATQIEKLGGTVSELTNYDPSCTHLLCPKPARNEKSLACMAAGKWVLHISYLHKSVEAGKFLNEEPYEFGNPKAVGNFPMGDDRETERRMQQMHWWRKEISRRGYGAFNDMRAILVAQKKEPIARVIEAGGGFVIDVKPPFDDTVHATHCLLEQKTVKDFTEYIPLARQGIYLLNTIYISDYLHDPNKDIRDCILPYFAKYYVRN